MLSILRTTVSYILSILLLLSHFIMSNSVWLHRRQPTRVLCPWDSPGKNTVVGCHFLLQCMHACEVASVISNFGWPYGQQPTMLLCPWDSSGKNTRVGCHLLFHILSICWFKWKGKSGGYHSVLARRKSVQITVFYDLLIILTLLDL